jgi:heptosyltransferase II
MSQVPSVLILSVSGIGNTILQSPLIAALLSRGDLAVDILFGNRGMAEVFALDERVRQKYVLPGAFRQKAALLRRLRAQSYDYSVACFPSNRVEFHLLPFLAGVRTRICHEYAVGRWRTLSFLSNCKVESDPALHDVDQNLNLVRALGSTPESLSRDLVFQVAVSASQFAGGWLHARELDRARLIGIHAGCKRSESYRRWPSAQFVELIGHFNQTGRRCLLFAGPDELEETRALLAALPESAGNLIVEGLPLGQVAELIRRCEGFLSTDSGLGHVARAMGVPTLAIFGPAQWSRTAPYGSRGAYIALELACSPCMQYPFGATHSRINCPYEYRCLRELPARAVFERLEQLITPPAQDRAALRVLPLSE